jgi:hypothetical protein
MSRILCFQLTALLDNGELIDPTSRGCIITPMRTYKRKPARGLCAMHGCEKQIGDTPPLCQFHAAQYNLAFPRQDPQKRLFDQIFDPAMAESSGIEGARPRRPNKRLVRKQRSLKLKRV